MNSTLRPPSAAVDDLVKQYLRMRGLGTIADLIDQETAHDKKDDSSSVLELILSVESENGEHQQLDSAFALAVAEDIVVDGMDDGEGCIYSKSYDLYRSWACSSLEIVKEDLLSVCFPLFVCW